MKSKSDQENPDCKVAVPAVLYSPELTEAYRTEAEAYVGANCPSTKELYNTSLELVYKNMVIEYGKSFFFLRPLSGKSSKIVEKMVENANTANAGGSKTRRKTTRFKKKKGDLALLRLKTRRRRV